jgi:hypothetical protein
MYGGSRRWIILASSHHQKLSIDHALESDVAEEEASGKTGS